MVAIIKFSFGQYKSFFFNIVSCNIEMGQIYIVRALAYRHLLSFIYLYNFSIYYNGKNFFADWDKTRLTDWKNKR